VPVPAGGGEQDDDDQPPKGVIRWLVSCDESGVHGARYYGFGTLWMSWQRRGDFSALIKDLRAEHDYQREIKWKNVTKYNMTFYEDLIEEFFKTHWLTFHCCLVERAVVRKEFHRGDYDLARRKHFTMLLKDKVAACIKTRRGREQTFRVVVDPIHSRYSKADEATEVICNNALAKVFSGRRPVDRVLTRDSVHTPSIQLCDLLLGATLGAWEQDASADPKLAVQAAIAEHLGWKDLRADTFRQERKFNVWMFYDPTRGPRKAQSRNVVLRYPLPPTTRK
jgi:hypothetical protein